MAFICFPLCVDESRWQRTAFSNRLWPSWQVLIYCTNVSRPQINCWIWTTNAFALSPIKMQKVWSKINKWFVTVINYNLCKTLLISEWSMNLILNFFFDGLFYFFAYCNAASWLSSKSLLMVFSCRLIVWFCSWTVSFKLAISMFCLRFSTLRDPISWWMKRNSLAQENVKRKKLRK